MTTPLCEYLEDYLLKDLAPEMEQAFKEHLADCEPCRLAAMQEARIDHLLKAAAYAVPCPPELPARIHRDWRRKIQKRWTKTAGLLVCGLVIGLLGWSIVSRGLPGEALPNEPVAEEPSPQTVPIPPTPPKKPHEIADVKPASQVRVEFPEDMLGLPIDSGDPDITLIQLFPVTNVSETSP
jgi:anti-sigma factor RsiW